MFCNNAIDVIDDASEVIDKKAKGWKLKWTERERKSKKMRTKLMPSHTNKKVIPVSATMNQNNRRELESKTFADRSKVASDILASWLSR